MVVNGWIVLPIVLIVGLVWSWIVMLLHMRKSSVWCCGGCWLIRNFCAVAIVAVCVFGNAGGFLFGLTTNPDGTEGKVQTEAELVESQFGFKNEQPYPLKVSGLSASASGEGDGSWGLLGGYFSFQVRPDSSYVFQYVNGDKSYDITLPASKTVYHTVETESEMSLNLNLDLPGSWGYGNCQVSEKWVWIDLIWVGRQQTLSNCQPLYSQTGNPRFAELVQERVQQVDIYITREMNDRRLGLIPA